MAGDRGKVRTVHHLGHMVARDGAPVGDAGGAVLVAAGIAAVGVALAVADEDRDVTLKDIAVHQHRITAVGMAQVHHIGGILAVMAGDLTGIVEFVEQLLAEDLPHLRDRGTGVQAVGDHQQHVLLSTPPA